MWMCVWMGVARYGAALAHGAGGGHERAQDATPRDDAQAAPGGRQAHAGAHWRKRPGQAGVH